MPRLICPHAYCAVTVSEFLSASEHELLGTIASATDFDTETGQRDAWVGQIQLLKQALVGISGALFLEYIVPRIGSRVDAVLVSGGTIVVLEFKVGESAYKNSDINQAWDYALDLKNFHSASHHAAIVPILVATEAPRSDVEIPLAAPDGVTPPARCNSAGLRWLLLRALRQSVGGAIDIGSWAKAPYRPTPTIIQAAQALYAQHSVEAIARYDAGAKNLAATSACIEALIDDARENGHKTIVFVTGVPGAGKTLVGLNIATNRRDERSVTHATYLSGNGPLVAVLREALTRDEVRRLRERGHLSPKSHVRQKVKAFIQNVHHFRDAGLKHDDAPSDRVVIFDEAQRAWNREQTAAFMKAKKKVSHFHESEPEYLISYMDRHRDWAVVVCLVGGGQEINRGEAGIAAWLNAIRERFGSWRVCISPNLSDGEYAAGGALKLLAGLPSVTSDPSLHLSVSMRSFRAENLSQFIKALLDCEADQAKSTLSRISKKYPIILTRDLARAKGWIRAHARGTERYGLVASSTAQRLKPHAIDVRVKPDPVLWFLNGREDTRSSYYLEDAATQYQVQGLELDWVCVAWDADLRYTGRGWAHHRFRGDKWVRIKQPMLRQYLINAYRVLLTRARQGMCIVVPEGDSADATRSAEYYDATFRYLADIGLEVL